jgi:GntR family transcriptional regulator
MQFLIDNALDRPVYLQIIDQVKRDIALGRLAAAERLPTVRQLAQQLAINPNTIAKAYRQLEQDGIIVTRAGAGAFVAGFDSVLSRAVRRKLICDEIDRILVEAFHMQIDEPTLREWFEAALRKFDLPAGKG